MKIRDRIKEFRRVKAKDLVPNPRNWRIHPKAQKDALKGILAEVGYAGALLARETPEGLMLIDGHLRAETTPDQDVPVLVLDVDESEANKLLATIDPIGAMAEENREILNSLLADIQSNSKGLSSLLDSLADTSVLEFDDPPESVEKNKEEIEDIKRQRREGKEKIVEKNDTEKYLVIVYPNRASRERALEELGLPTDERYIAASAVSLTIKKRPRSVESNSRSIKPAPANKSGANG